MATLVGFHAHPDDEAIAQGGTLARASSEGHRVVLVFATRGELGEYPSGFLTDGETLASRRERETQAAADALGVHRVEFLGYIDSGMDGTASNDDPACFACADVDDAASKLARLLTEESADVLTVYDEHGTYGHPDHIQVHRVGHRAAEMAATPRVYEATMNRDHLKRLIVAARDAGMEIEGMPEPDSFDGFGLGDDDITTVVDVTGFLAQKRAAMAAHASQIAENSIFLSLPEPVFAVTWGTEFYVRMGAEPGTRESWLFDEEVSASRRGPTERPPSSRTPRDPDARLTRPAP
jgi:LmbE family N-acetylglucosaminyl deacetylase